MLLRKPTLYNKLAWPAGIVPGFDPNHPASKGINNGRGISAVATSGLGYVSVINGRIGTKVTGPTGAIRSHLGPAHHFAGGTNDAFTFSGQSAAIDLTATFACIVMFDAFTANQGVIHTDSSGGGGILMRATATGALQFVAASVSATSSGITLSANTPYFIAASCPAAAGTINFIVARLDTGTIVAATATAPGSSGVPNGTYIIGSTGIGSTGLNGYLAAVMFSTNFLSMPQLRQWASDPWAFWYPRNIDLTQIMSPAVAAGFLAAWAQNSNLPVLGTGTY